MNRRVLTLVLITANLVLGLVVAREWVADPGGLPAIASPADGQAPEVEARPLPSFDTAPLEDYEEIVARPLFNENRQPEVEEDVAPGGPVPTQAPFTLVGVVITPQRSEALLLPIKGGEISRQVVGESREGWRIESIEADRVVVSQGGGEIEVLLERHSPKAVGSRRAPRPGRIPRPVMPSPPSPKSNPSLPVEIGGAVKGE